MKKARLIYNPTSGRELLKKQLPYILHRLEQAGYETSAHMTTGEGCAKKAARLAAERKYDLVIAAGGDGTIYEVVNGLAELEYRPTLGLIPAGTTNDFARALGIPREIEDACDILCNGHSRPIDIGKVGEQYFVNIAAGGTMTELTYEVPSKLKTMIGQAAYYIKGLEKLPFISPSKVVIEYDDNVFEGDIMLFLVCNTKSVGGFERLAASSELDDGYFDLIIVEKITFFEFVKLCRLALLGEHMEHIRVKYVKAKRIKVNVFSKMQLNLDGEYGGMLPAEFINLYHHFNIIAPEKIDE